MLPRLQLVFKRVLNLDDEIINEKTTIDNFSQWDSMKHLELIMEIEKEFGVEFQPHEVILLNSVDRIMREVELKLKG